MAIQTAKDILSTYNLLDKKSESKRKPKNEFQAYAYRLAHDLNDLVNLKIYMRLSKNLDRSLMERAYSFVSDSHSTEKGRLFLWKLKSLRIELQKKRDAENFEYEFVIKQMKIFRNKLAKQLIEKADLEFTEEIKSFFTYFVEDSIIPKKKKNLLLIGNSSRKLLSTLLNLNVNSTVFEISSILNKTLSSNLKTSKIKLITKDFIKNKFKDKSFDYVIIYNYWQIINTQSEVKFLNEFSRIIKEQGKIMINTRVQTESKQEWKEYKYNNEEISYFTKINNRKETEDLINTTGFNIEKQYAFNNSQFFILKKKSNI